jgi:sugar (pentulose or hexulose) kinase
MTQAIAHPPAEVVIGLDIGTTAVKVAAFGARARLSPVGTKGQVRRCAPQGV